MIMRIFMTREFSFIKKVPELSLQDIQWNLCGKCFQDAQSCYVVEIQSSPLVSLI